MQNKVSEPTPLYESPPVRKQMSPEDVALCQQAIELANSGQKQAAYEQFCAIYNHGNTEDVTLLYWLAFTTPSPVEARRAMDSIARLEPGHPKLQELRAYVDRKEERQPLQQPYEQWQPPVHAQVPPPDKPKKRRTRRMILIFAGLLLVVILGLCALLRSVAQPPTPYPWNVTVDSGYSNETTFL